MKAKKPAASRVSRTTARKIQQSKRAARPLHKRVLLHPFSTMVLLCAGVLIAGSTLQGLAASYDVTATVPAEPPPAPAVISSPYDQQHTTAKPIDVSGTCPAGSYVKLYRNNAFSGAAMCANGLFQIQTDLTPGGNKLQSKVYNATDQEGPAATPITVYYDPVTITPVAPVSTPAALHVENLDASSFQPGQVQQVSANPTVSGFAPPLADVVITFHSSVLTCKTKADSLGWWSCTLDQTLPPGRHQVDIAAKTLEGLWLTFPTFHVNVLSGLPPLLQPPVEPLLALGGEFAYQTHFAGEPFGWNLNLSGGTPPFAIHVVWGDQSETNMTLATARAFSLKHAFPEAKIYTIFVNATDAKGQQAALQLTAQVKGPGPLVANITQQGPLSGFLNGLRRYLWIVWPVYIAVVLMVISYWLGEREVYIRLMNRRKLTHRRGGFQRH